MRLINAAIIFLLLNSLVFAKDLEKEVQKLMEKGKLHQAENLLYEAQARGEFSPKIQLLLAKIYFLRKDYKNAYETLMGIENPQDVETKFKLLTFLKEFGDSALSLKYRGMAINVFYKLYTIDPTYSLGSRARILANYMMEQGDFETAKKLYDKFLEEGGSIDEIIPNFVRCLYMASKWREIVKYAPKIVRVKEDAELQFILGESYYNLAKYYHDMEMPDSALAYVNLLIQFGTPKIYLDDAYFLRGLILYDQGETQKALESFYKVLAIAPPRSAIARKAREKINEIEKR
ncbi:MAG: tetratricopeptide repeat protein [candidate division WOR-3 bacterium]